MQRYLIFFRISLILLGWSLLEGTALASGTADLKIMAVLPSGGPLEGSNPITLIGTQFAAGATISMDGNACTKVTIIDSTRVSCVTPSHAAGSVNLIITNGDGKTFTLNEAYTYRSKDEYLAYLAAIKADIPDVPQGADATKNAQLLYDWIGSLDDLNLQGRSYGFNSPYDTDLAELGMQLTRNAASLVHVQKDHWDFLRTYYSWSDDVTRLMVAQQQAQWITMDSGKDIFLRWHGRLSGSIEWLRRQGAQDYVLDAFAEVDGLVISKLLLLLDQMSDDEIKRVLMKCESESAIQAALDRLEEAAIASDSVTHTERIIAWTLLLTKNLKALRDESPYSLRSYPGRVLIDAVIKTLRLGGVPDAKQVPQIAAALTGNQYLEFGGLLSELYREEAIDERALDFVDALSTELYRGQKAHGILRPSKDFLRFIFRTHILHLEQQLEFEGVYDVDVGGVPGVLTLILTVNGTLIASLTHSSDGTRVREVTHTYSRTMIDLDTNQFSSRRYFADAVDYLGPDEPNAGLLSFRLSRPPADDKSSESIRRQRRRAGQVAWMNSFRRKPVDDNKRVIIEGVFHSGVGTRPLRITGELRQHLEAFPVVAPPIDLDLPLPTYFGNSNWELTLTQAGDELAGHLNYRDRLAEIYLPISFVDRKKRVFYLNSAEQSQSGSHIQLRVQLSADESYLSGYYIIGGREISPIQFHVRGPLPKKKAVP